MPDIKIRIDQIEKIKSGWPISGWRARSKATHNVVKNVKKYFTWIFEYFLLLKIKLIKIIKNGFTNSIGWNLGKKSKSIHLFEPFTSIPINGTEIRKINEIKKINKEYLKSFSWFIEDRTKITTKPMIIKIKCLKKKE